MVSTMARGDAVGGIARDARAIFPNCRTPPRASLWKSAAFEDQPGGYSGAIYQMVDGRTAGREVWPAGTGYAAFCASRPQFRAVPGGGVAADYPQSSLCFAAAIAKKGTDRDGDARP